VKEQAEAAIALAAAKGASVAARTGFAQLAALAVVALGWFWLAALGVDASLLGQRELTFWQALGALNAGRPLAALANGPAPSPGIYGVGALVCLAGPLLAQLWRDRRAHLAALLPLAFMASVALPLDSLAAPTAPGDGVALGAGAYVTALAALYVALTGLKRFLVAKAYDSTVFYENK
jgi:hypothetical protein